MKPKTNIPSALLLAAAIVAYIVSVLVNLGYLELAGEEPRRVLVTLEMFHSGNFIRPTLLGWDYYNKPPVFNWILAFFIWLTGSASEFVVRLPSLVFYLLLAFFHYRIAKQFLPARFALLSAFFILTCGDVYFYGLANGAEIDLFYGLIVYLQAISLFWYYQKGKMLPLYLVSYLLCAIGFLTKGFPSVLFQGLTLAALCMFARSAKVLIRWQHLAGLLLFTVLVFFYFFLYKAYSPPYRYLTNLLNEALIKSAIGDRYYRLPEKAAMYPFLFLKMLLPWSLLLLLLFEKIKFRLWENPLVRFSLLFILLNLWVYWFTGQPKIRYVYMFLPFACTILAYILHQYTKQPAADVSRLLRPFGLLFAAIAGSVLVLPFFKAVSLLPTIILALMMGAVTYFYFRKEGSRIWLLFIGIIVLRLIYASLFIPLQHKGIANYRPHVQNMLKKTNGTSVTYTAEALPLPVLVNTSFFSYQFDTVQTAPHLSYQIPYYYYCLTGRLLKFDSSTNIPGFKLSYGNQIGKKERDTLYRFFDGTVSQLLYLYK